MNFLDAVVDSCERDALPRVFPCGRRRRTRHARGQHPLHRGHPSARGRAAGGCQPPRRARSAVAGPMRRASRRRSCTASSTAPRCMCISDWRTADRSSPRSTRPLRRRCLRNARHRHVAARGSHCLRGRAVIIADIAPAANPDAAPVAAGTQRQRGQLSLQTSLLLLAAACAATRLGLFPADRTADPDELHRADPGSRPLSAHLDRTTLRASLPADALDRWPRATFFFALLLGYPVALLMARRGGWFAKLATVLRAGCRSGPRC